MEAYSHDEVPETKWRHLPEVVVKPENISQVSEIMNLANREGSPVTPRGAGTWLAAGAVPFPGGIVLSLEKMNRIIEVDQQNLVMVVEPGVTTGDVQRCAGTTATFTRVTPVPPIVRSSGAHSYRPAISQDSLVETAWTADHLPAAGGTGSRRAECRDHHQ